MCVRQCCGPGALLHGRAWQAAVGYVERCFASYDLSVYGPNGFVRYFKGSIGAGAAALDVVSGYDKHDRGSIEWKVTNVAASRAEVSILDAYTGKSVQRFLQTGDKWEIKSSLDKFYGWYDLIITVAGDQAFKYRLAGHVETGKDSFSDPVLGVLRSRPDLKPGGVSSMDRASCREWARRSIFPAVLLDRRNRQDGKHVAVASVVGADERT